MRRLASALGSALSTLISLLGKIFSTYLVGDLRKPCHIDIYICRINLPNHDVIINYDEPHMDSALLIYRGKSIFTIHDCLVA